MRFRTTLQKYFSGDPYVIINSLLAVVLLAVFIYSAVFSPEKHNYPIQCIHELRTGEPCPTCGFSHAFSYLLRGDIEQARLWNENALPVFVFFALQLLYRLLTLIPGFIGPKRRKALIYDDITLSILFFTWAFIPVIRYYLSFLSMIPK